MRIFLHLEGERTRIQLQRHPLARPRPPIAFVRVRIRRVRPSVRPSVLPYADAQYTRRSFAR